ncbi:MAG: molybdopterin converting factor subunit 1 [Methyloligellaceae bacterium]
MKLRYFAWVREKTGIDQEEIELPDGVETVADLIGWLRTRGPEYAAAFETGDVIRTAIDQAHVKHDAAVGEAQEIAFFPPVTGG